MTGKAAATFKIKCKEEGSVTCSLQLAVCIFHIADVVVVVVVACSLGTLES